MKKTSFELLVTILSIGLTISGFQAEWMIWLMITLVIVYQCYQIFVEVRLRLLKFEDQFGEQDNSKIDLESKPLNKASNEIEYVPKKMAV